MEDETPPFQRAEIRKYTYDEVSRDYELFERIAKAYLQQYSGSWAPIIDLQQGLKASPETKLVPGVVKMVLNTMLHDCTVINMPRRPRSIFNASAPNLLGSGYRARKGYDWDVDGPVRKVEVRKRPFELKGKWKKPYAVALGKAAYVVHVLDKEVQPFMFYPNADIKYIPRIRWFCSSETRKEWNVKFLTEEQAKALIGKVNRNGKRTWHWCIKCDDMSYAWEHREGVQEVTEG